LREPSGAAVIIVGELQCHNVTVSACPSKICCMLSVNLPGMGHTFNFSLFVYLFIISLQLRYVEKDE